MVEQMISKLEKWFDKINRELEEDIRDIEMGRVTPRAVARISKVIATIGAFIVFAFWLILAI